MQKEINAQFEQCIDNAIKDNRKHFYYDNICYSVKYGLKLLKYLQSKV